MAVLSMKWPCQSLLALKFFRSFLRILAISPAFDCNCLAWRWTTVLQVPCWQHAAQPHQLWVPSFLRSSKAFCCFSARKQNRDRFSSSNCRHHWYQTHSPAVSMVFCVYNNLPFQCWLTVRFEDILKMPAGPDTFDTNNIHIGWGNDTVTGCKFTYAWAGIMTRLPPGRR